MQEELLQFKLQEVWTLVDLPNGKRAIGSKWVFRNKKDERGIVIRNKARLVAQGYTQEEGINYDEVFAPVARIKAIRLFLAYASFKDFVVYQMDVKSAFLYGKIEVRGFGMEPMSLICGTMGFKRGKSFMSLSSKGSKVIFYWSKFMWMISSLGLLSRCYALHRDLLIAMQKFAVELFGI
ncbi:copia protein [Tanacetum coccineum]